MRWPQPTNEYLAERCAKVFWKPYQNRGQIGENAEKAGQKSLVASVPHITTGDINNVGPAGCNWSYGTFVRLSDHD